MIWCVEDDASVRDIEIYTLKTTDFEAEGFTDGEELFAAGHVPAAHFGGCGQARQQLGDALGGPGLGVGDVR